MPVTRPPVATPAPTLRVAGWLWLAWLATAAGLEGMPPDLDAGADEAANGNAGQPSPARD